MDGFGHVMQNGEPALVAIRVVLLAKAGQTIIEKSAGVLNQLAEFFAAIGLDETVRVVGRGNNRHAHGKAGREQMIQRMHGGVLSGLVGIEAQHDFVDVAFQNTRVLVGERRALRRDNILHAGHETGDEIKLAFANDGKPGVQNRALGFVETEENLALGENRRLRRVDVFRRFFVAGQNASTEADHPALLVANWKHEPPAKTVVVISRFLLSQNQPGLFDKRKFVVLALRPVNGVVPQLRRCAEAKQFHRVRRNAAFGQIIARDLTGGFVEQAILPALRDFFVDVQQLIL